MSRTSAEWLAIYRPMLARKQAELAEKQKVRPADREPWQADDITTLRTEIRIVKSAIRGHEKAQAAR